MTFLLAPQYGHNTLLACPIRATVTFLVFLFLVLSKCLPKSDFYLPQANVCMNKYCVCVRDLYS